MNTIVITGGAGFLGSNLAVRSRREWPDARVIALDNLRRRGSELILRRLRGEGVEFVHGDVRCKEDLARLPAADVLLECSAEPSASAGYRDGPDYVLNTNLLGAANCLEYARRAGAGVIFFSTSRVYPIDALNAARYEEQATRFVWTDEQTLPGVSSRGVTEEFPLAGPRTFYGMTKLAAEMLMEEYRAAYGLRTIVNRCGVIAGPWQMGKIDQGIVAFWAARHWFGLPLKYIGFGGAGKQVRDVLHVDDLCDLATEQMRDWDRFEGETFNVGGGLERSVSLQELTALCREATGREVEVGSEPATRPGDVRAYVSDCRKLFSRTAWRPRRSVRQIVEDVCRWLADYESDLRAVLA